jgi:hypothetical protein
MMVSLSATSVSTPASKVPALRAASIRASTSPGIHRRQRSGARWQRQNAVEPALDRREIVGEAAFLLELEAGALAEIGKANAGELALMQQMIPAGQRLAGVIALEVVGRIEQVLPARLPLAARQRAKRIEAAGDGRDETPLAAAIGGDGAEHRRRRLMGAVGAAKPLMARSARQPGSSRKCIRRCWFLASRLAW